MLQKSWEQIYIHPQLLWIQSKVCVRIFPAHILYLQNFYAIISTVDQVYTANYSLNISFQCSILGFQALLLPAS